MKMKQLTNLGNLRNCGSLQYVLRYYLHGDIHKNIYQMVYLVKARTFTLQIKLGVKSTNILSRLSKSMKIMNSIYYYRNENLTLFYAINRFTHKFGATGLFIPNKQCQLNLSWMLSSLLAWNFKTLKWKSNCNFQVI